MVLMWGVVLSGADVESGTHGVAVGLVLIVWV